MATTNTNTGGTNVLSTDIYDVSAFIDQIRSDTIPDLDGTSSMVGIFGYMNEAFSQSLQNTLITVAETSNEAIATRAKFTKNVIAHAMNLGITDIFAKPASMTMMLYLPIAYIEQNFTEYNEASGRAKFILDKNVVISIEGYQFHFDYDIIINRIKNAQGNYVYTAMYDLFESGTTVIKQKNPISDITNPYITTLIQTELNGDNYIAFSARLHQVSIDQIEKTILTNNSIENKSITFDFDGQLAAFDVDVIENGIITHLVPVYQGLLDNSIESNWCYYEFLDESTIRILFDRDSYLPGLNAQVKVNIKICEGSSGNFTYTESFKTTLASEKYNDYNGMYAIVYPLMNGLSSGGKDKKSIKDLKKIIPREASSRGAIINTTDLQNFFNSIDDDTCKIYFKKKRDNQFERMYYAYILMKKDGYVYPTNTLSLKVLQTDFKGFSGNNNLVLKPGTKFYYYNHGIDTVNDYATLVPPVYEETSDEYDYNMTKNANGDLVRVFEYTSPFLISIDDDLITSYIMTVMNEVKTFKFISINTSSDLQFIATNMNWNRKYIYEDEDGNRQIYDNKYTMTIDILQNNSEKYNLVRYHMDDDVNMIFDDIRIKVIMVLYTDDTETNPYRYIEAELINYDINQEMYTFQFTLFTDDTMDLNNRINITGVYNAKPEAFQLKESMGTSHGYMNKNTYAKIFIMADFGTKVGDIKSDGSEAIEEEIVLYPNNNDGNDGNRAEIESLIPNELDIIDAFLNNSIYTEIDNRLLNVVNIIRSNNEYLQEVFNYNGNEQETDAAILRYLRNNKNSNFVINTLLNDEDSLKVINAYNFVDLNRYTVCNVLAVDGGIDFYHDYSSMMRSNVSISKIQEIDESGNPIYQAVTRTDNLGLQYTEYKPKYKIGENNNYIYNYILDRVPMICDGYLNTEELFQDYIYDLEERRKYITECLYVLEDTFGIDLKFFNTYGPSKKFYYNIPSSQDYKAKVAVKELKVLSNTSDEDDPNNISTVLSYSTQVHIIKVKGQWGLIDNPCSGWIKIGDVIRDVNYIDNVALSFKWALEAQTSADKYITENIIQDIKEYIEDINEITEVHIPNIITLITNNYREQLVYFEFLDVNGYGSACQHLYHNDEANTDICPEFLNIATNSNGTPEINITVY